MTDRIETALSEMLGDGLVMLGAGPSLPAIVVARAILAEFQAARIAVVELPEPTAPDFTGTEWSGPDWDVFAYGSTRHRGEVEVRSRRYNTPETAREFGAALLAAADAAEASQ